MDVQGLRNYVRAQLDVDDEELPDSLLNVYLQEAFDRTMAFDNRWPRNEATWVLSKGAGDRAATLPPDLNIPSITSVFIHNSAIQLSIIDQKTAEDWFTYNTTNGTSNPMYASVWEGKLHVWPAPDVNGVLNLVVRGYRQPVWANGASDIPDLDSRLHVTLAYFAIALSYAQQEDEVLEGTYMARWDRDLRQQLRAILDPVHNRPLVLHGSGPVSRGPAYVVNPPGG